MNARILNTTNKDRSIIDAAVRDDVCDLTSTRFVQEMDKYYKRVSDKKNFKAPKLTEKRLDFIKGKFAGRSGPFVQLAVDVSNDLKRSFVAWAEKVQDRIDNMFRSLQDVLLGSFEGKKMSEQRRAQVAPEIKRLVFEGRNILETDRQAFVAAFS